MTIIGQAGVFPNHTKLTDHIFSFYQNNINIHTDFMWLYGIYKLSQSEYEKRIPILPFSFIGFGFSYNRNYHLPCFILWWFSLLLTKIGMSKKREN